MKTIVKPVSGLEFRWRMRVMTEMPSAPPIFLNMFLKPTTVPTFSGINSMQALFAAGKTIPPQTR